VILLICAFAAVITFTVFAAIKSSSVYQTAVARAKADPRVTEAIGTPIRESWVVLGSAETSGGSGKSDLTIPLKGSKGNAVLYVLANKFAGEWQYERLLVKIDKTGETIDLIDTSE